MEKKGNLPVPDSLKASTVRETAMIIGCVEVAVGARARGMAAGETHRNERDIEASQEEVDIQRSEVSATTVRLRPLCSKYRRSALRSRQMDGQYTVPLVVAFSLLYYILLYFCSGA